jgi:hypothetical protein
LAANDKLALLLVAALVAGCAAGCGGKSSGAGADGGHDGAAEARADADADADADANADVNGDAGPDGAGGTDGSGVAAPIVVDTPSGMVATESWDGYCDILEAIEAANTDQPVHECPAGAGADRIVLAAGASYPTTKTLRPSSAVTIGIADGASGSATITAAPGFVTDAADRWSSCLVYASGATADVRLADVALAQDPSLSLSGACVTLGRFQVRRVHVAGFQQGGIVAICLPEFGCDHDNSDGATTIAVLGSLIDHNRSPREGAGIFSQGSGTTLTVEHSAIIANVSALSGGGLYFGGGWATHKIEDSTVSGNTAVTGGGVLVSFAPCTATYLYVLNSTIADNSASQTGGGIELDANVDCYSQDVTVLASIVTGNSAAATAEANINADWRGGQFNCDRGSLVYVAPGLPTPSQAGGTPCRYDVPDALLAPLMPMGGTGNLPVHALRRGSPAIDAATDDLAAEQQRDGWIGLYDPPSPPAWTLFDRVVDGDGDGTAVRDLGAYEANDVWQAELLAVAGKGPGAHAVVTAPDGYDRGAGTSYAATGASGEFVTYVVPIAEPGRYALSVGIRRSSDAGQLQAAVADDPGGPWTDLGAELDGYAAASAFAEVGLDPGYTFGAAGQKLFRFTVTGKAAASNGYGAFFDYIKAVQLP